MRSFEEYIEERMADLDSSMFDHLKKKSKPKQSKKSARKKKK